MTDQPPLLLIPGLLLTADLWAEQIAGLGGIAAITVTTAQSEHDSLAAIAAAILAQSPARFALAGLSLGGYVALEIMRQAPGRVARLALLDTSARPDAPEQMARRRGLIELASKGRFKGVTPRLLPLLVHPDRRGDHPLLNRIVKMAGAVGRDGFIRQQQAIMGRPDSRPALAAIRCPTLVLCGDADQLTPPELAREMADGIGGAELVIVERAGHLSPMEQPEAVTHAMRAWLAGG
jgi:pimeloyl-ACP methyl ester carboxylesterase